MNKLKLQKLICLLIGILNTLCASSQKYNNEWISYGSVYYKFRVVTDGMYRIGGGVLSGLGITAPGSQLQLWRNGEQVPLYVSTSGTLSDTDYIEFYGRHNDGSVDAGLFRQAGDQLNKGKSFETDSSTYFLTTDATTADNYRYTDNGVVSVPAGLTPEAYFMYTVQNNLGSAFSAGPAENYGGDYVYMSDYKYKAFGAQIKPSSGTQTTFGNLYPYTASGVGSSLSVGVAGSSTLGTNRTVSISGTGVSGSFGLGAMAAQVFTVNNIAVNNSSLTVTVSEANSASANDISTVSFASLTYPRTFDFGGQSVFAFGLGASTSQRLLQISDFNAGGSTPVLYDLTNRQRYTAVSNGSSYEFVLPAGMDSSDFVLAGQATTSYTSVSAAQITPRTFTDYGQSANQGNFLIISDKVLINGSGNYVNQYAQYRNSTAGGSYNAKVYDIEDLEDQFAYGIKGHPLSIKNFLRYARAKFSTKPSYVLLIGRGLTFNNTYGANESNAEYQSEDLIPTYGYPASDILLSSDGFSPVAATPIGRISAVNPSEVGIYLDKVKAYEQAQQNNDNTVENNVWKKNMAFVSGGSNASEESLFGGYLQGYEQTMSDTLFGGRGYYFSNQSSSFNTSPSSALNDLFVNGMSFLSYYGHGAGTTIGYAQLGDPSNFGNNGQYPLIFTSGCDVGNCFDYMPGRATSINNITERYLFTQNKGSVGFVAQTFLGITNILDDYNRVFYNSLRGTGYGKPVFNSMQAGQQSILGVTSDSISRAADAAQTVFLGDPSISLYGFSKPDFAVDAAHIYAPASVSVTDTKFTVKAYLYNIGKATGDSVSVQVQRRLPGGTTETLLSENIASIKVTDSLQVDVPIDPDKDAGNNDIIVTIDGNNKYDELSTANNTATKTVVVYTNGLTPVYPYNYSIIHTQGTHLTASTSDALAPSTRYIMEMDTSKLFNSPFLVTKNVQSIGGAIDFDPGISYTDSTVYYWRVSPAPSAGSNTYQWANSSFQYIGSPNTADGAGQSHLYQHQESAMQRITLDSASRQWIYGPRNMNLFVAHGVPGITTGYSSYVLQVNGSTYSSYYSTTPGNSIIFEVFDPNSFKPYYNQAVPSVVRGGTLSGFMGSITTDSRNPSPYTYLHDTSYITNKCDFQFSFQREGSRDTIAQFMDWIPDGAYVIARVFVTDTAHVPLVSAWQADGTGAATLYNTFTAQGLSGINQFTAPKAALFIYKKNDKSFDPVQQLTTDKNGQISITEEVTVRDSLGYVTSPVFGPAQSWKTLQWNGRSEESPSTDNATVSLIGYDSTQSHSTVLNTYTTAQQNVDISSTDAAKYPYLQLELRDADSVNYTPYQLRYWHLLYTPVPEGALAGNDYLNESKDTINAGQDYSFAIAFKNVSDQVFTDSLPATVNLTTSGNVSYTIPVRNLRKLGPGDTAIVHVTIPGDTAAYNRAQNNPVFKAVAGTPQLSGLVTLAINVNPKDFPKEQFLNNNDLFKTLFVKSNIANTNLDVTFDGIHILNNDIISSKPDVVIHLTSDSKYILLTDTSAAQVSLKYPDGTVHRFGYNSDTLVFTPAKDSNNNEALVDFKPYLTEDGTYQLIVNGQGQTGTSTNASAYTVSFQVYNRPMISDMFNYPNPFTSSTAFVFTITGSEVPQNIRIEIMTITGKIVKEITRAELGNLHVGRNITDYKWDGTDMYGQKLANGVYLYRVITNEDGKSLGKFNITDQNGNVINTDKYFNKGYGKMYLMR